MKTAILVVLLLVALAPKAQPVAIVNTKWITDLRTQSSDTLYIINFWATWCKPCVEELPAFDTIEQHFSHAKIKVILVSTDMKRAYPQQIAQFIQNHQVRSTVVWMSEPNADRWINATGTNWSGAIPTTWFIQGSTHRSEIYEGEFSADRLYHLIRNYLK